MKSQAYCDGHTGCSSAGVGLARWNIMLEATPTVTTGTQSGDLEIVGSNGESFPIFQIVHFTWSNGRMYFFPVASNGQYSAALLATSFLLLDTLRLGRSALTWPGLLGGCTARACSPRGWPGMRPCCVKLVRHE